MASDIRPSIQSNQWIVRNVEKGDEREPNILIPCNK